MNIPFNKPFLSGKENEYISDAISLGKHCGNGKYSRLCQEFFQQNYQIPLTFLTPSATAALEMSTILADIQPGDEVIMPSYTFSSTANAFCLRGAIPVFVDIDPQTFVLNHRLIEEKITPRTKAIVPINYGGVSPELDAIIELAKFKNLTVIEDCAQGVDAKYRGRAVGSISPISIFSFHETKNISCGEGGALLLNDSRLQELATFAQEKGTDRSRVIAGLQSKYSWVSLGSSYLLSELLAAMLYSQLLEKERILQQRKRVHDFYTKLFMPFVNREIVKVQEIPDSCESNYHGFYAVFPSQELRDQFIEHLKANGIWSYIGYLALHSSKMGKTYCRVDYSLPITEKLEGCIVRMPLHCSIEDQHLQYISEHVQSFFRKLV